MDFHFVPPNVQILHKFTQPKPKLLKDQKAQPQGNDLLINLLILCNFVHQLTNQSMRPRFGEDSIFTLITGPNKCYKLTMK